MSTENKISEEFFESLQKLGTIMNDPNIKGFLSNDNVEDNVEDNVDYDDSPDQDYDESLDSVIVAKAARLLKLSILATDFDKVRQPWNMTTCQDILHSVYNLRKNLEKTLYLTDSSHRQLLAIEKLIRNVLRPFAIEWHGSLFYNTSCNGTEMNTEAIYGKNMISSDRLALFQSDVLEIQQTFFETIKELDPGWEV